MRLPHARLAEVLAAAAMLPGSPGLRPGQREEVAQTSSPAASMDWSSMSARLTQARPSGRSQEAVA